MANQTGTSGNNTLLGTNNDDTISGLGGNDRLEGRNGNDRLIGGAGIDMLIGGAGNDTYVIDGINEINKSLIDAGIDTVESTMTYALGEHQEHLTLLGSGGLNGTGNAKANILKGNSGANQLGGLGANDTLNGGAGNDILNGGTGDDRLLGGAGNDTLIFDALDSRGVDGGAGTDKLKVVGGTTANLVALNSETPHFTNIETIDLNAPGAQGVVLNRATVLELSDTTNTLRVTGDTGDTVVASSGLWTNNGSTDGFTEYRSGAAILLVEDGIDASGIFEATATIDLGTLNGTDGFRLDGTGVNGRTGISVASAGDIDGDGFDDLIIGDAFADPGGVSYAGSTYVVFGKASGFSSDFDLSGVNGTNGFRLDGINEFDTSGRAVASAGDVNGDGLDDLIVGAFFATGGGLHTGAGYVVFGRASGFDASLDLGTLNGTDGFRLDGIDASDYAGVSVASAGDVNGDGFADLILGAGRADPEDVSNAGESYVVFGQAGGFASSLDLGSLNGSNGFRLDGFEASSNSGYSVATAGDVNGDGFDDLIIGASNLGDSLDIGAGFVVLGRDSGFESSLNLGDLNGTNGFRLDGAGDSTGYSVAAAGDVNGDGLADLIIGAPYTNVGENSDAGQSFVVFGSVSGFQSSIDLGALNGTNGFSLNGISLGDRSGTSVASAGDVNGDGFDDVIVGAFFGDPEGRFNAGESYVIFGKAAGIVSSLNLATLNGANGFRLDGTNIYDRSGSSVASAGDVNGDGYDDLVIGAPFADPDAVVTGAGYLVFGRDFRGDVDFDGGSDNDTFNGSSAGEVIIGGTGNDTLNGGAGADVLKGAGDDDVVVGGSGNDRLEGGSGTDSLNGSGDDDRLFGENGDDVLDGGLGNDALEGGEGNDVFRFDDTPGATNIDTIMDFGGAGDASLDMIQLDNAVFTALPAGALTGAAFESGDGQTEAATPDGRIIYDTASGALYYDADGDGGTASVQFAVIASDVDELSAADFEVISG